MVAQTLKEVARAGYNGKEYVLTEVGSVHTVDPITAEIGYALRSPKKLEEIATATGWGNKVNVNYAMKEDNKTFKPYSRQSNQYKRGVQKFISFKGRVREMDVVTKHADGKTGIEKIINVYFDPSGDDNPRQYDITKGYNVNKQQIREKGGFIDRNNMRLYFPETARWGKEELSTLKGIFGVDGKPRGDIDIKTLQSVRDMKYIQYLNLLRSGKIVKEEFKSPSKYNEELNKMFPGTKPTKEAVLKKEGYADIPGAITQRRSNRIGAVGRKRTTKLPVKTKGKPKKNKYNIELITSKQLSRTISNIGKSNMRRGKKLIRNMK